MQLNETGIRPADTTREILHQLFGAQPRGFAVRLWDGTLWPERAAEAGVVVALTHAGALRRMLGYPLDLALGESFIRGDFDVEGDLGSRRWCCVFETKRAPASVLLEPGGRTDVRAGSVRSLAPVQQPERHVESLFLALERDRHMVAGHVSVDQGIQGRE